MDNQFGPLPLNRELLHQFPVPRQATVLDNAPRFEVLQRLTIRVPIERHRQVEFVGPHTEVGAGERHPLGVPRQLKVRLGGLHRRPVQIAIAQDVYPAIIDPAVYSPRHLQDLVGAQMRAGEHILSVFDHVRESRVVDDHRVEPLDVQGALSSGGHREKERLVHSLLEKGTDHANGFAPMIKRRSDAPKTIAHQPGHLFHRRSRGQKHPDPAFLLHDLLQKLVIQKIGRIATDHAHIRCLARVEGGRLNDRRRLQIPGIEARIHRRRQPDEATPHPLA